MILSFSVETIISVEDPRIPQILSQIPNVASLQQDVNKKSWVQTGDVASLQQDVTEMALKTQRGANGLHPKCQQRTFNP